MPNRQDSKKKHKLIVSEILRLYEEGDRIKKRVLQFTDEVMKLQDTLQQQWESVKILVDNKIISKESRNIKADEIMKWLYEYSDFIKRYKAWLEISSQHAERVNEFQEKNNPQADNEAYLARKITLQQYTQKFESVLKEYKPLAHELILSHNTLNDFENEYRKLVEKTKTPVN